jgi:cell division protein FtsI/penicillin-binding protein 2
MTTGCILVLDVRTATLRACVSVPGFDPADPAASLEAPDSPFLNRALQAYAVGSVFKPVLAAAALEAGLAPEYDCNGAVVVDGQIFRCAGGVPHGEVDLSAALAKSCNGYFIRLGQQLGAQALLQQAQALGFGRSIGLAEGLTAQSGALPGAEELAQSGQLANFSFGQGSLLATPLQVAAMMNTIASGGVYRTPFFVCGSVDETDGTPLETFAHPQSRRVMSAENAALLRKMLQQVEEGTAQDAAWLEEGAGGKTGTAQTGQFTPDGTERKNLWFAGFYPAQQPRYTIVVLQDGQVSTEHSSAAIFARLCAMLDLLA